MQAIVYLKEGPRVIKYRAPKPPDKPVDMELALKGAEYEMSLYENVGIEE